MDVANRFSSEVIIVGAGPVGLTLALLLGRKGISVNVIEAGDAIVEELRASTFHPPTLDLLDTVGISLVEMGLVTRNWQVRDHATGEAAVFDMSVLRDETAHPYRLQCEQHKLSYAVAGAIRDSLDNVGLFYSSEVVSIDQSDSGVSARTVNGDLFEAKYLVGCDGAKSMVRRAIGQQLGGQTYPETMILTTTEFDFAAVMPGLSYVNYVWTNHPDLTATFSLLKVPGRWRTSLYPLPGETEDEALGEASLQRKLQAIHPRDEPYEIRERRAYRIHQRIVDCYYSGRIALCGDAAHINSPSGGMGLNGGIQDAFNLADKLPELLAGSDRDLLAHYDRQRRPIAEEQILKQADRNRARMWETDPSKRRMMLDDLKAVAGDPVRLKERMMTTSMIEGYRQSLAIT